MSSVDDKEFKVFLKTVLIPKLTMGKKKCKICEVQEEVFGRRKDERIRKGGGRMKLTVRSGGAPGADMCADKYFSEFADVVHYSFDGHGVFGAKGEVIKLTEKELSVADLMYEKARAALGRNKTANQFILNLCRRNFYQVREVQLVIAVGELEDDMLHAKGGTAYAIEYAKELGKTIIIYDQERKNVYVFVDNKFKIADRKTYGEMLRTHRKNGSITQIAMIGTRRLNDDGEAFIVETAEALK